MAEPIQCPHCEEWFGSEGSYYRHRRKNPRGQDPLRCLSAEEMLTKKMRRNQNGHWVRTVLPPGARDGEQAGTGKRKPYGKRTKDLRKELAGRYRQGWV